MPSKAKSNRLEARYYRSILAPLSGALDNLILNAIQNSHDGAPIVLRAEIMESRLRLSVSDAGHGVPEGIREHLFEPFATRRPDGTGLGLAIVREMAEAHGGSARVEHREGGSAWQSIEPTLSATTDMS